MTYLCRAESSPSGSPPEGDRPQTNLRRAEIALKRISAVRSSVERDLPQWEITWTGISAGRSSAVSNLLPKEVAKRRLPSGGDSLRAHLRAEEAKLPT